MAFIRMGSEYASGYILTGNKLWYAFLKNFRIFRTTVRVSKVRNFRVTKSSYEIELWKISF